MKNKVKYILPVPQYGLGSWLKENAGTIGSVAGMGLGALLAPATGGASLLAAASLGSTLGGSLGGMVQKDAEQDNMLELNKDKERQMATQNAATAYQTQTQNNPLYGANFANGGVLNSLACGGKVMGCGGKMKADGGMLEATRDLDNITYFGNGGTHSTNNKGGITLGSKGQVEQGEVRYNNYVFSNRF